jgi:hypothetical protein
VAATGCNLLDFNEITVDDKGHALYGYSDGCVSPGCIAGVRRFRRLRVSRGGGKSLFAKFDSAEPTLPKRACLAGTGRVRRAPELERAGQRRRRHQAAGSSRHEPGKETLAPKTAGNAAAFVDSGPADRGDLLLRRARRQLAGRCAASNGSATEAQARQAPVA